MTGLQRPAAKSGQTFSASAREIAAFSSTLRGRSVEPVWTRRLAVIGRRSSATSVAEQRGDLDDTAVHRGRAIIHLDIGTTDHVEDDIGAAAVGCRHHGFDEILGLVIDGDIGAEAAAESAFFRRARGDDDRRAERLGEHDRGRADARRAAVHEQRFAGLQAAALEDIRPDREESLGDRRRLDERKIAGNGLRDRLVRRAIFGIAAAMHERTDLVARSKARRAGALRGNKTGDLEARQIGSTRRWRIAAQTLRDIRPVDAGGGDLDEDFTRSRARQWPRLGVSTSGGPGSRMAMQVMVCGRFGIASLHG